MTSTAEVAIIHRAMTVAEGSREAAAAALNMPLEQLAEKISDSEELSTLWARVAPAAPTVGEAYDRDRPKVSHLAKLDLLEPVDLGTLGISSRDMQLSEAFHRQEAKLQKFDWEGLGVKDGETLSLMKQFEGNGVGRGVLRMMDAMQGGMAFCFAQVSRQFADVATQLQKEQNPQGEDKINDARVMMLHARFMDLAREMQKFNKEATNAAHTRLLIADRAKKIQQAGNRLRKPTWRTVKSSVAAQGGKSG